LLRAAGLPDAQLLVWAWNPLVIWECAGAAHIDAAGLAAAALAMLAAARGRRGRAGAMLGIAVLFKLLPAALFPAVWRRWDWWTPVATAAVVLLGYAAYASAGWQVFGYLPGYAAEEGLGGRGFLLVRLLDLVLPHSPIIGYAYVALCLLVLAGLTGWVSLGASWPDTVAHRAMAVGRGSLVLSGALITVLSPHYPWYMTMLVLPAVLVPAWSAIWLTIAAPLLYLDDGLGEVLWPALVYVPALPLLIFDFYRHVTAEPAVAAEGAR
jgi:alpha-1,6-mannosyltransferase